MAGVDAAEDAAEVVVDGNGSPASPSSERPVWVALPGVGCYRDCRVIESVRIGGSCTEAHGSGSRGSGVATTVKSKPIEYSKFANIKDSDDDEDAVLAVPAGPLRMNHMSDSDSCDDGSHAAMKHVGPAGKTNQLCYAKAAGQCDGVFACRDCFMEMEPGKPAPCR